MNLLLMFRAGCLITLANLAEAKTINITISRWHMDCSYQGALSPNETGLYVANLTFFKQKEAGISDEHYLFQATSSTKDICDKTEALLPPEDPNSSPTEVEIPVEMTFGPTKTYYKSDWTGSQYAPRPACFLITHEIVKFTTRNNLTLVSATDHWGFVHAWFCEK